MLFSSVHWTFTESIMGCQKASKILKDWAIQRMLFDYGGIRK